MGTNTIVAVSVRVVAHGKQPARVQPTEPVTPTPRTPRKSPRSEQQLQDYARPNAPTLKLTADEIARTKLPLIPVPDALAHPPASGLLYRYWDENSYGWNSETGFVAGRFMHNNLTPRPAPKTHEVDDTDVENHLDRNKVASPFCSASNCLLWIMRLALHEARNGAKDGKITLVDVEALPAGGVYHVKPFHKRIKARYCFKNGAWRYCGTHEFIIWHEVPCKAIIHTFALAELLDACDTTPAFAAMLRVETVGKHMAALKTTTVSQLQEAGIALTAETVTVIARLCKFVGLTGRSPLKQLEHFLQMAFLHAVRGGLGEFNMMHDPVLIRRMQRKALLVGLGDPRGVVMDSVASATAAVGEYEQEQTKRYAEALGAKRLLPRPAADRFQLEGDVGSPDGDSVDGSGVDSEDKEIMYDEDLVGL
ncbi:hypothetical protein LTR74_005669 [Friedmanniomyces endolithicus]|nr:hypothetical protein LTR74_005669 [Friedmanniomyces endolithicus]